MSPWLCPFLLFSFSFFYNSWSMLKVNIKNTNKLKQGWNDVDCHIPHNSVCARPIFQSKDQDLCQFSLLSQRPERGWTIIVQTTVFNHHKQVWAKTITDQTAKPAASSPVPLARTGRERETAATFSARRRRIGLSRGGLPETRRSSCFRQQWASSQVHAEQRI